MCCLLVSTVNLVSLTTAIPTGFCLSEQINQTKYCRKPEGLCAKWWRLFFGSLWNRVCCGSVLRQESVACWSRDHVQAFICTRTLSLSLSNTHKQKLTRAHTCTPAHSHSHSQLRSHTNTHTHSHTRARTHRIFPMKFSMIVAGVSMTF